jgi:hypothetical protein
MAPQGCVLSLQVWVITQIVYDTSLGSWSVNVLLMMKLLVDV